MIAWTPGNEGRCSAYRLFITEESSASSAPSPQQQWLKSMVVLKLPMESPEAGAFRHPVPLPSRGPTGDAAVNYHELEEFLVGKDETSGLASHSSGAASDARAGL